MKKLFITAIIVVLVLNILAVGIYIGSKIGEYNAIKYLEEIKREEFGDFQGKEGNTDSSNENKQENKDTQQNDEDNKWQSGNSDINDGEKKPANEEISSDKEEITKDPAEDNTDSPSSVCEHCFEDVSVIKEAKCKIDGAKLIKCQKCGEEKKKTITALGHIEVKIESIPPTCEKAGTTEGAYCSECGEILVSSMQVPSLGHTIVKIGDEKAPTCTESGASPKEYCSFCGEVLSEAEIISPLGHTEISLEGKAATCTESGLSVGTMCSVCEVVLVEREVIPAGHKIGDGGSCSLCGQSFFTAGLSFSKISGSGEYMVSGYSGNASQVKVPSEYNGGAVVAIGSSAFSGSNISGISLPSSIRIIESNAFKNCTSLSSISLPSALGQLGYGAFYNCTALSSVSIPSGLDSISSETFRGCSGLRSVSIPSNIKSIGENAFYGCSSLSSVNILGASSIGNKAFYGCVALNSVTLSNAIVQIGSGAFQNCRKISTVTYSGSREEYESISFSNSYSDPLWNGGELKSN